MQRDQHCINLNVQPMIWRPRADMGVSGLSCPCKNNTFSNGLSLSPCRVMDSGLEQQVSRAASTVVLRPRLPLYCRASQCHSLSGKQRFSHDARRPRQVAIVQAEAAHFASGLHRRWSISSSSSSSTSEASREQSAVQFEICRIPGDGSCLFRALAQGVHQLETGAFLEPLHISSRQYYAVSYWQVPWMERHECISELASGLAEVRNVLKHYVLAKGFRSEGSILACCREAAAGEAAAAGGVPAAQGGVQGDDTPKRGARTLHHRHL